MKGKLRQSERLSFVEHNNIIKTPGIKLVTDPASFPNQLLQPFRIRTRSEVNALRSKGHRETDVVLLRRINNNHQYPDNETWRHFAETSEPRHNSAMSGPKIGNSVAGPCYLQLRLQSALGPIGFQVGTR